MASSKPERRVMNLADGRRALQDLGFDSLADALDEVRRLRLMLQDPAGVSIGGVDGSVVLCESKRGESDETANLSMQPTAPIAPTAPTGPFSLRSAFSYENELERLRLELRRLEDSLRPGENAGVSDGSGHVIESHGRVRKGYASLSTIEDAEGGTAASNATSADGGGPSPSNPAFGIESLLEMPMRTMLRQRLPWLVILLLFQSSSAAIMDSVEAVLSKHIVLPLFVPMLVGSAGNAGIQPGVAITRALGAGKSSLEAL